MKKDVSPEERLLALIKGRKNTDDGVKSQPAANAPEATVPSPKKKADYLSEIFKIGFFKSKFFRPGLLRSINKYLIVILAILAVYFLAESLFIKPDREIGSVISELARHRPAAPAAKKEVLLEAKSYSDYLNYISSKNIFSTTPGGQAEGPGKVDIPGEESSNLGLVGIIAGNPPQAVIEDKKSQKTYYLGKGDSFDGFVVEEISEGKVMLDYGGKKIALFL